MSLGRERKQWHELLLLWGSFCDSFLCTYCTLHGSCTINATLHCVIIVDLWCNMLSCCSGDRTHSYVIKKLISECNYVQFCRPDIKYIEATVLSWVSTFWMSWCCSLMYVSHCFFPWLVEVYHEWIQHISVYQRSCTKTKGANFSDWSTENQRWIIAIVISYLLYHYHQCIITISLCQLLSTVILVIHITNLK